ncbi:hypothetical protein H845_1851 [Komagataeibacter xylinus E25]|nr:hypothetical protein H845_1851 [Komagataeibacter xylinus E25]
MNLITPVSETATTVTVNRADWETILNRLDDRQYSCIATSSVCATRSYRRFNYLILLGIYCSRKAL